MIGKPFQHFLSTRIFWLIRANVDEWHAPVFCRQQADGVASPGGGQHDHCLGALEKRIEARQELPIDDVRKPPRIGCFVAIQDAVDVKEDDFHAANLADFRSTRGHAYQNPVSTNMAAIDAVMAVSGLFTALRKTT
jgi:hypothetical protein